MSFCVKKCTKSVILRKNVHARIAYVNIFFYLCMFYVKANGMNFDNTSSQRSDTPPNSMAEQQGVQMAIR